MIIIEGLSKVYEDKLILEKVDFEIKSGSITTIIGPNGAGKTSLIKIILGLLKQSSGRVIFTKKYTKYYVPQKRMINTTIPISVADFVIYNTGKNLHGIWKDFCALDSRTLVSELSGGELQKVLLSVGMMKNTDFLVLDEANQYLDIESQEMLYSLIKHQNTEYNTTILIVSHDLYNVLSISKNVICLNKKICCVGRPGNIEVENYMHSLKNIIPYNHTHI